MGAKKNLPAATAAKNTGGRPEVHEFTPKELEQAKTMYALGLTFVQVASVLNMSLATFERRMKKIGGYEVLEAARTANFAMLAQSANKQALGHFRPILVTKPDGTKVVEESDEWVPPNWNALRFLLNIKGGKTWVEKRALEVTGEDGGPLEFAVVDYRPQKLVS